LVKAAEAAAPGLQPDMHAFVLWQAAKAYSAYDPEKTDSLLRRAFTATLTIENADDDRDCRSASCNKGWLQGAILADLAKKSPESAEVLLPQATPGVRSHITALLISAYIHKGNLPHARELLTQIADDGDYPFQEAAKLIEAFQMENSSDKLAIFLQALNNFEQNGSTGAVGTADFATMISEVWEQLPSRVILEAIDKILDDAKSNGESDDMHTTMSKDGRSVSLDSLYQLRLFQLLPVVQQLDPLGAESLTRDDAQARDNLQSFPKGMPSPSSASFGASGETRDSDFSTKQQSLGEIEYQMQLATDKADKDPQQALGQALTLPMSSPLSISCPRVSALVTIARKCVKEDPKVAKSALDEALKLADQLSPEQELSLKPVPEIYLTLGDMEGAGKAVKVLSKAAERLYAEDINADDPNQAFKGAWPSSSLWRGCVIVAGEIAPEMALEIIGEIPDDDIAAFEKVSYAGSLLGAPSSPMMVATRRKKQSVYMTLP